MGTSAPAPHRTVAQVMITTPATHGVGMTISEAGEVFEDAHVHMLLLISQGELFGTVVRDDIETPLDPRRPAMEIATLAGRTIDPSRYIDDALLLMNRGLRRRLAVVDSNQTLVGLLCLKRTRDGFCSEADVLARRN